MESQMTLAITAHRHWLICRQLSSGVTGPLHFLT